MSVQQFNGKIVLTSAALTDVSSVAGSKMRWSGTFHFIDNTGKYLGADAAVGDLLVLDTSSVDVATVTSYQVEEFTVKSFDSFTAIFSYLEFNANPTGPPDLSGAVDQPGVIVRRTPQMHLADLPAPGIQQVSDTFPTHLSNDNYLRLDALLAATKPSPVVTKYGGIYTFIPNLPANQRQQIITSPGITGGFHIGAGEMEVDFEILTTNYYTGNNSNGGHIAVVLRCDTSVIDTAVRGQGMILGNVAGHPTGALHSPTTQIETWFNGLATYGNYLPPESAGYADKLLADGVRYRVVVSSKVIDKTTSYIRYRLYRYVDPYADGLYPTWTVERDTGDVLDRNTLFDSAQSGLVFGHVFANPSAAPWSIEISNIVVTWRPAFASPTVESPSWLRSPSGESAAIAHSIAFG